MSPGSPLGDLDPGGKSDGRIRTELAASVRRLIEATVLDTASSRDLAAVKELVDAAAVRLGKLRGVDEHRMEAEAGIRPTLNPFGSAENPLAPPLREKAAPPGEYVAGFVLSAAYEGPPGRAHGGVVAGILDHASGFVLRPMGILAVSVSLTVNLHHPTPYGEPLTVTARIDERDGRKIWVDAEISTESGGITASARTLMLQLRESPAWERTAMEK